MVATGEETYQRVLSVLLKMTPVQRYLTAALLIAVGVLGILLLVFNEKIFHLFLPVAEKWKLTTGGWIILWLMTFVTAFPPLIGYSTCGTLAGFVYGVWEGWLILATATVAGSFCSFIASRTVLRNYVERMVANDKRYAALSLTLQHDGLKLLCMIRLCPLPYSISNGAMSTISTVEPSMYALATALITPKLLIHAFIGSRLAAIARTGGKMSAGTRAINYLSIIVFGAVGVATGLFIFRKTMARAAELEAEELRSASEDRQRTGLPPRSFTDDPEAQAATASLADDDNIDYFDDAPSPKPPYSDHHSDDEALFGQGDGQQHAGSTGAKTSESRH